MASSEGGREIEAAKKRLAAAEARASADATAVQAAKDAEESAREMAAMAKQTAEAAASKAEAAADALKAAKEEEKSAKGMTELSEKNAGTATKNREGVEAQLEASTKEVQDAQKRLKEAEERWKVIPIDDSDADEPEYDKKKRFCDKGNWGTYDGELNEDGWRHGKGKMTYDDGEWYDGHWDNDTQEGQGTYRWADGAKFDNGDMYEGQWENGNREGQGTFRWSDGREYKGQWKNDVKDGQGTCRYADGDVYEGQWKDDAKERGTYYWKGGDVDVGSYKDGNDYGEGVRWSKDRRTAWLTIDGEKERKISLEKANEMATRMGFDGVPPPNGPTTTTPSTNNTNSGGPTRVTVSVTKPSKDTKLGLGIGIKKGATCICVESIPEKSLFSNTDLEVGMAIETVNGESYDTFQECLALLKGAEGDLTLVAVAQAASPLPPA